MPPASPPRRPGSGGLRHALLELAALVLPAECGGCGRADTPWCRACAAEVTAGLPSGPRRHAPAPATAGAPPMWVAGTYAGALAGAVVAYKDEGRRDLAPLLATMLAVAVDDALADIAGPLRAPILLVPVPSSRAARRRRGDAPLEALARGALAGTRNGPRCRYAPVLRLRRPVADQAALGAQERAANLEGAMRLARRHRRQVVAATCLVVDDVITTGATLTEAARALRAGGATDVRAAAVAATRRRPFDAGDLSIRPDVV